MTERKNRISDPASPDEIAAMASDRSHRRGHKMVNYDRGRTAGRAGQERFYNCREQYRAYYEAGYQLGLSEQTAVADDDN